jgi:hypothetical protein
MANLVAVATLGNGLQVRIRVPKGRRIVAQGGASDSGHSRNPGETEEASSAPKWAADTTFVQSLVPVTFRRPFQGSAPTVLLAPRVSLRFTLGYDSVALPGLRATLSRVSRQKLA